MSNRNERRALKLAAVAISVCLFAAAAAAQTFCVPPQVAPQTPPQNNPAPRCSDAPACANCQKSPCYVASGIYKTDAGDMTVRTQAFPLNVDRRYMSNRVVDGPLGIGWTSTLTPRIYYATFLLSAPSTYLHEADVVMPDMSQYRFTAGANGSFTPPRGRFDTLVRNTDGTFALTLQHTRSVLRFAANGTLTSKTDDYGNAITYTYDGNGRVQRIADSSGSGRYLDVVWGADGRISEVTDSFTPARHVRYYYDSSTGTLTSVAGPVETAASSGARSAHYTYVNGRFGPLLSSITDRWDRVVTQITWDASDRVSSYTEGAYDAANAATTAGELYTYTYYPNAIPDPYTVKTDSLGGRTYKYDSDGLSIDDGAIYDYATGLPATTYDGSGWQTDYTYTSRGNLYQMVHDKNNQSYSTNSPVWWTYTYDATYPEQVAAITPRDVYGNPQTNKWPGRMFEYYGASSPAPGALHYEKQLRTDGVTADIVGNYVYDSHGRLTTAQDRNAVVNTYTYNAAGDVVATSANGSSKTMEYDSLGRVVKMTDGAGHVTEYTWDAADRLTSVKLPKPYAGFPVDTILQFTFDGFDLTLGLSYNDMIDANNHTTRRYYDALGNLVRVLDVLGGVTQYGYTHNLLTTITDANGNVTTFGYDQNRNMNQTTFPEGGVETRTVAADGTLTSVTDRKGTTRNYYYDPFGRLIRIYYPGHPWAFGTNYEVTYGYDGMNMTGVGDQMQSDHATYFLTYDTQWRLITYDKLGEEKATYTYPASGTLPSTYKVEPPSGTTGPTQTVSYTYDGWGRVSSIGWNYITSGVFTYTYTADGDYASITFPNGRSRTYTYDGQDRITSLADHDPNGGAEITWAYGYDQDWPSGAYTLLGELTSINTIPSPNLPNQPVGTTRYHYDANGSLTRSDDLNGTWNTWSYDLIGNRTAKAGNNFNVPYTYYKNGSNPNNGRRMRSALGPDMTYDLNGNLTAAGPYVNYTWDIANRLSSANGESYTYDYLKRRVTAPYGNTTTRYVTLGSNTVGERNASVGIATDYLFGPGLDEPLARRTADGSVSYYTVDGQGSVVAVTGPNGTILSSVSYSPWGEASIYTGELFGYTGREAGGPGWFNRARYYSPADGRFISEDLVRNLHPSPYEYPNSPLMHSDRTGYDSEAHVCCDGKGGFTICWDKMRPDGHSTIRSCLEQHERDHVDWIRHDPANCNNCKDKKNKENPELQMTPADRDRMECRAYKTEIKCLQRYLGEGQYVRDRWNQMKDLARGFAGCNPDN